MPGNHHHRWGPWGDWFYAGDGKDGKDRTCQNPGCPVGIQKDVRGHRHDRGTETTVKGVRVRTCDGCGATL
jgi:hypothetical protein